jgi:DtxR family Mn-dependent transcriptional regulator
MLSQAVEDYLKAIYKLQGDGGAPKAEIARTLGVSAASVSSMANRLAGMGLARHESYRGVSLTAAGEKVALEIIRHHRLLETYLKEVLDYPWDRMHEEAEHLEHHISEEFEEKIEELLGYPTHDPHGDPIPTRDGRMARQAVDALADASIGQTLIVSRVSDDDPGLLRYLESVGLLPGASIRVQSREAVDGSITVQTHGSAVTVHRDVAERIFTIRTGSESFQ